MRKILTCFALACALVASTAHAEPSAKALALTRRMVAAMHIEETMTPVMRSIVAQEYQMAVAQEKGLTEQQRSQLSGAMIETMDEILAGGLMSDIMEKLVPAYAAVYTEDELQALVDFYESPIGQRVLRKMPQLGPAATKAMAEITPKLQAEMTERLTKKLEGLKALGK
ncbi:DUF2059 domain-containing protein [uncultured Caulobacter sp.]|uniref:DUF2059 domain-containing protein n=1 Tax=uncultured Caulobacter sp. TaxID=158749 RepID=UPI00262B4584|nr:DUF2059 domain-containing protein [uncultured Caulobacter sp.]